MRAIDTNVLVRLLARDDARQTKLAEAFVEKGAWISHVVLAETVWVLASVYDFNANRIATTIGMLLQHAQLSVQDPEVVVAALEVFKAHPKVGFSDCLIVEIARKAGRQPLGTFDRHLGNVDGASRIS